MSLDARKNFAVTTVATAPSPATSGTSLVVASGKGTLFPATPFNAIIWPTGANPTTTNAEIVRVTGISTDTFTITRTQESSSARTVVVGDQIAAGLTDKSLKDIEDYLTGNSSPTLLTPTIASLTNAQHNHQNAAGGATLAEAALALTDVTTANASTSAHGFLPKGPNNSDHAFLRDDITWVTPRLVGEITPYGGFTAPTGWKLCDGSAISRSTFSALFAIIAPTVGTFTVTIASPAVVTLNGHGLLTGDAVYLTTSGALPTGLSANTLYYAIKIDANTFNLATTRANAYAATKINTSGTQSGTHTLTYCPYGLGDGSTTFNLPDLRGRVPAGSDGMGGTAASRLTATDATNGAYGNQGASGGEQSHTLITAELAQHNHSLTAQLLGTDGTGSLYGSGAFTMGTQARNSGNAGSGNSHNNVQPTLVLNYLIKT